MVPLFTCPICRPVTGFRKLLFPFFLVCAAIFSVQVIPRWFGDSIVMDEEWEITCAYYYWTQGDCITKSGTTAPGALCALPLLALNLKADPVFGHDWRTRSLGLIYMDNPGRLLDITVLSRAVNWLIALGIGFLLYRFQMDNALPLAFSSLALWAFEPTLLFFSGTAKTDLSIAFWLFLSVWAFQHAQTQGKSLPYALAGILAGLTAATRYNGFLVLPVLFVMEILRLFSQPNRLKALKGLAPLWLCVVGGFLMSVSLCYLPGTAIWTNAHPNPLALFYYNLTVYLANRGTFADQGITFAGHYWPAGSYLNFPYHFFFKNTLPFDLLLFLTGPLFLLRKIKIPTWVWVPPTVYLGLFWLGDKGMTIHHALPVYPFLILLCAYAFNWLWEWGGGYRRATHGKGTRQWWIRGTALGLLAWHGVSVLIAFPHHIAYANELLNAQDKHQLLYTFNWNLGQDMKRLAQTAHARGWKRVKLLTEQRTDPYFYGLPWLPWTKKDLAEPQPGTVYVVDPSILYDIPFYGHLLLDPGTWVNRMGLHENIGGTLYYYESPGTWDPTMRDDSPVIDSFIYYRRGVPPYQSEEPRDFWIAH